MGTKSRESIYGSSIRASAEKAKYARQEADRLACVAWNQRMLGYKGPAQPSPTLGDAINAGYLYLEVRCLGCDTHQTVALDIVRRPKTTPIHDLERYMRCKDCSEVRGYPYKRSHLVALRLNKISADDPPSTWWPRGTMTPTRTSSPLLRLAFFAAIAITITPNSARTQELVGQASVIDGDTLEIQGTRIRLWGIDAPEHDQLCRGDDSLPYLCGAVAANKLDAFIAHRPLYCAPEDIDRYGRTVASCRADATDLGDWLVGEGLALDWPRYSKGQYGAAQREAERAGRGMWAGSYVEPWTYRGCIRAGGHPAECSDDTTAYPPKPSK